MLIVKKITVRVITSTRNSWQGIRAAIQHEEAFRLELILYIILSPLAIVLGDTGVERVLLVGSLTLVLLVELINSAIEATIDRIGKEHHPLSGRAKDMGSAAVFIALINVVITWGLILLD